MEADGILPNEGNGVPVVTTAVVRADPGFLVTAPAPPEVRLQPSNGDRPGVGISGSVAAGGLDRAPKNLSAIADLRQRQMPVITGSQDPGEIPVGIVIADGQIRPISTRVDHRAARRASRVQAVHDEVHDSAGTAVEIQIT